MRQKVSIHRFRQPDVDNVYIFSLVILPDEIPVSSTEYLLPTGYNLGLDSLGRPTIWAPNGSMCYIGQDAGGHPRLHSIHEMTDPLVKA